MINYCYDFTYCKIEKRFQQEKIAPKIIQLQLKDRVVFSEEELKKALAIVCEFFLLQ
jgi:hypothetical protein